MDCYHCDERQAQLKCADCDSQIFRFCSQQCGLEAHDDHLLACYNRANAEHLEEHLFDAIEEMEDPQKIEEALDVLVDLEDQHPEAMQKAHEMIQSHLEFIERGTTTKKNGIRKNRKSKKKSNAKRRAAAKNRRRQLRAKKREVAAAKRDARDQRKFDREMAAYNKQLEQTE